jgi:hypothetical protein
MTAKTTAPPSAPDRAGQDGGRGWKVEPSSNGRGAPPPPKPPMVPGRMRTWLVLLLGLLVLNLALSFITGRPSERAQVPYQPFFTQQVADGNVQAISSQEETIQGELKEKATYDPPEGDPVEVTEFETQVPTFVTTDELTRLLADNDVVVNAERPDDGRNILGTLLLGFLPTLLLIGAFVWIARRQAAGAGLGRFGRSTARRVQRSDAERVTFDDVAGIDEVENELASRAGCCCTGRPAPARRCWRVRWRGRPTPRSSRCRRRSSSRRSSASARRAFATCSSRRRRRRPRSCSSTSTTPSAARARATSAASAAATTSASRRSTRS